MKFNTLLIRSLPIFIASIGGLATSASPAIAEVADFAGEIVAVADPQTFEAVTARITGEAAKALFNVTAAITRIQGLDAHTRIVRGRNISCYEHFATSEIETPITYSCDIVVWQGGKIERPTI